MAFGVDDQCMMLAFIAYGQEIDSKTAVDLVPAEFYDGAYKKVHTKFHQYLKSFRSKLATHVPDIINDLIANHPALESDFVDIFAAMDTHWKQGLNRDFVFTKAKTYVTHRRWQVFASQLTKTLAQPPDEENLALISDAYKKTVSVVSANIDVGVNLKDQARVNESLIYRPDDAFFTGITPLDNAGICPTRKQLFTVLAPPGSGKSTALLHFATTPWWRGGPNDEKVNVLYLSLEQSVDDEIQRLFRARGLYTEDKKSAEKEIVQVHFGVDTNGRADPSSLTKKKIKLTSDRAKRDKLHETIASKGEFFIRSLPSNFLTPSRIEHMIDAIKAQYGVDIDMVFVDYIRLMKRLARNEEDSVDENSLAIRDIARSRDLAMSTAQQINREGEKALASGQILTHVYIQGDKRLFHNTDKMIVLQQTEAERREQLARLWADKGRQKGANFMTVISQNYAAARFAISSGISSLSWEKNLKAA